MGPIEQEAFSWITPLQRVLSSSGGDIYIDCPFSGEPVQTVRDPKLVRVIGHHDLSKFEQTRRTHARSDSQPGLRSRWIYYSGGDELFKEIEEERDEWLKIEEGAQGIWLDRGAL